MSVSVRWIVLVMAMLSLSGCGSFGKKLKSWLGGGKSEVQAQKKAKPGQRKTYSQSQNHAYNTKNRKYKRMTKEKFENSSRLEANRGSLWVMEGQGPYLFSQNMVRLHGDILNVKLEGSPKKQLDTKVEVINNLLKRLQAIKKLKSRKLASKNGKTKPKSSKKKEVAKKDDKKKEKKLFDVDMVPVRIVEKLTNGDYRVRGGQTFMIGRREYKVIVTGIVKASDIDDGIVSSQKMLDSKFDIVSPRREVAL